ncbi:MAG: DUF3347 domain-containing protein [Flavobacteriales bacterium]
MLNKLIKYFLGNKLVTVVIIIAWITRGVITSAFYRHKAFPKELVPVDAINLSLFAWVSHSVWMGFSSDLKNTIQHIQHVKTLEEIRKAFIPLSNTMIGISNAFKPNSGVLYVIHCPMADNNKGADWLSSSEEVKNPYYGQAMPTCGEVIKEIE